ncbi:MAG: family 10 glycosylhydrolase [Cyanobacteria bacterium J06642_2]
MVFPFRSISNVNFHFGYASRVPKALAGLGALAISLGFTLPATALPTVTVVREEAANQKWSEIEQQLQQADIDYRVLDREDVAWDELTDVQVLFLPNAVQLTAEQMDSVEVWMKEDGGLLIASGPVSQTLSSEAKSKFRELAGAYWSEALDAPSPIARTTYPGNDWTESVASTTSIQGGTLVPTGMLSRLSATWQSESSRPVAVVSTQNSIYFGWNWGDRPFDPEAADLDAQWLNAALNRFDKILAINPTAATAAAQSTERTISELPINTLEMLSMRLELGNLLGRVESAILTTNASADASADVLPEQYRAVVSEAREVVDMLPEWVQQGRHRYARQAYDRAIEGLWKNYPSDRLTALPEVRAIWLDRGTIVESGSPQGLAEVFDRLAAAGINTVFFETINAGYPIYPSRIAPTQNPLTQHWDPLKAAVQLASERDMELHAWMWTFATGNSRHNALPRINLPRSYPGPVLSAHPDWANKDNRGRLFPPGQPETWLDPSNPAVRSYLLAMIREIVGEYGVDGVHLDYIRYPFQNPGSRATFGYGRAARQEFERRAGIDPIKLDPRRDRQLWEQWTQFRADQVSNFVAQASQTVRDIDSRVILSTAVYSMPSNERMQKLQQQWETWISRGDIDLLVPMTYAANTRRLEQLVEPALEAVSEAPVLFLPSVNLLDLPRVEFLDQMQVVRDLPTGGYALFATRQLNTDLQSVLKQSRIPSAQVPYRNPFGAAVARFDVLQKEWQFLLDNEQIWIGNQSLMAWQEQIEKTAQLLAMLEQSPSESALRQARAEVAAMRENLPEWLRLEALKRSYRVNTWQNRLFALEAILRYGDRNLPRLQAETNSRPSQTARK